MRFSNISTATFPSGTSGVSSYASPAAFSLSASDAPTLKWKSINEESGNTSIIVPGGSVSLSIALHQLILSWSGIDIPGRLVITSADSEPLLDVLQNYSGVLPLSFVDLQLYLSNYGLRVANNSQGGEYHITAFYTILEN